MCPVFNPCSTFPDSRIGGARFLNLDSVFLGSGGGQPVHPMEDFSQSLGFFAELRYWDKDHELRRSFRGSALC